MFNFSKVSSLALGLAVLGGLGLSSLASANTPAPATPAHVQLLLVEGGSDRLPQNRVVEGGADRLQELRERVAEGGSDRLIERRVALINPASASRDTVVVAENRAEFGSKYQRY